MGFTKLFTKFYLFLKIHQNFNILLTKSISSIIIVSNDTLKERSRQIKDFLKTVFLFSCMSDQEIALLQNEVNFVVSDFKRGECIFCKNSNEKKIGFVYSGKCEVREVKNDGSYSVLNQLNVADSFGLLSVFSDEEFPTEIFALTNSKILFLSENDVKAMLTKNAKISVNLIKFMAERISFLNKKIKTFTGTRVEDRLFSYLLGKWRDNGDNPFSLNFKKCSEAINSGRASVYRAIDSLEKDGMITVTDKKIKMIKLKRN